VRARPLGLWASGGSTAGTQERVALGATVAAAAKVEWCGGRGDDDDDVDGEGLWRRGEVGGELMGDTTDDDAADADNDDDEVEEESLV
jgi:hypothetical protein